VGQNWVGTAAPRRSARSALSGCSAALPAGERDDLRRKARPISARLSNRPEWARAQRPPLPAMTAPTEGGPSPLVSFPGTGPFCACRG
jgi:hypothetical protein